MLVQNPFKKLNLQNYFSKDILDIKWIPKLRGRKNKFEETDYNKKFDQFKYL